MDHPPRREADPLTGRVLRDKGGFLSPVISVVEHDGRPAVLKDYRAKNAFTRGLLAPSLVRREYRVLRHLAGVPGVPKAYAIIEKIALLVEYVEGKTLNKFSAGELPDAVFDRLCETVRAMHRRRVVHLDLRQKKNILIAQGRPYVIDFANALMGKMASKLAVVDESALLKWKKRNWPHLLTDRDREALNKHKLLRKFWIFTPRGKSVR